MGEAEVGNQDSVVVQMGAGIHNYIFIHIYYILQIT